MVCLFFYKESSIRNRDLSHVQTNKNNLIKSLLIYFKKNGTQNENPFLKSTTSPRATNTHEVYNTPSPQTFGGSGPDTLGSRWISRGQVWRGRFQGRWVSQWCEIHQGNHWKVTTTSFPSTQKLVNQEKPKVSKPTWGVYFIVHCSWNIHAPQTLEVQWAASPGKMVCKNPINLPTTISSS